ncbi:MAG: helix-turn-helix transcriptional regulator [bacterium]|nr:helix-turn-helix transcriptional regulator [bacterium]
MKKYPEYPHEGFTPIRPGARGYLPTHDEPGRTAFLQAASPIREWIYRGAAIHTVKLENLYLAIGSNLGDPELDAKSARRHARSNHPRLLKLFRRSTGISVSEYIERRQMEVAARMIIQSELPLADVAEILGYADEATLVDAVERWCGATPEAIREDWEKRGVDVVIQQREKHGESPDNSTQQLTDRVIERLGWKPN